MLGTTDSGDQPEVVEKYMGMTVFPKDMLRVADGTIQAEAGGVQLFADTVRSAEGSAYGTNALFDEIVLRCYPLVFDPDMVIAVQDPNKFMGSGSIGHTPVIKSKLNQFFENERRMFNSDTLYVAQ